MRPCWPWACLQRHGGRPVDVARTPLPSRRGRPSRAAAGVPVGSLRASSRVAADAPAELRRAAPRPGRCPGGRAVGKLPRRSWLTRKHWPAPERAETLLTKRALITGITGQDGSYLAEHLHAQGYEVWGLIRGQANPRVRSIRQLVGDVRLVRGDLLDQGSLISAVERVQPDEVYNLAAISYVPMSWQQAELTGEVTGLGVLRVLEAIRVCSGISASRTPGGGQIRFYQASSSEMFGMVRESPQTERTPFHPRSPYGVAKTYGHFLTQNYRESYGMYAVSGILFNHESPRRGAEFVSRKISLGVAKIKLGYERQLRLGNLSARRDWGFAGDYVRSEEH